jgi:hypothetical protein
MRRLHRNHRQHSDLTHLTHKELRYNNCRKEKFAGSTPASHQRVADSGKDKDTSFLVQRLVVDPAGERLSRRSIRLITVVNHEDNSGST